MDPTLLHMVTDQQSRQQMKYLEEFKQDVLLSHPSLEDSNNN